MNWFSNQTINIEASPMQILHTMEVSAAATRFWIVLCCSIVIEYLANEAECRAMKRNHTVDLADACPDGCNCDKQSKTVNCTDAGFQRVPNRLPSDTLNLILDGNEFRQLSSVSFENLPRLQNLSLRHCQINRINKNAFSPVKRSLLGLWLANNPLTKHNYHFLLSLENVQIFDMSSTKRKKFHEYFERFSKLRYLFFANNSVAAFPTDKILPESLEFLDLTQNLIKDFSVDTKTKRGFNMKKLILRANAIQDLKDDTFRHFRNLEELDLSHNQLSTIQPLAFRLNSLKIINLHKSSFDLSRKNWNIFQEAPNIERINMSFCRIESGNFTRAAFHHLRNLTDLDLSGTGIS